MSDHQLRTQTAGALLLAVMAGLLLSTAVAVAGEYLTLTRGVSATPLPGPAVWAPAPYGVNVRLHDEATRAGQRRLLEIARSGGYGWVRQEFLWAQIEPERGRYDWQAWDDLVALIQAQDLRLIAVLDTSPAWSRASSIATAPPDDYADYARFAGDVAARYRGRVAAYQIWDQPNIRPYWGSRYASPQEYTRLLQAAFPAIKAADPQAVVLAGGLAPTTEQTEWNQSDLVYLQGMYRAGARGFFDVLAAKPYGFWTGPDDRRVDPSVLNFSRLILLREVMERNGDGGKGVWAVEMGWNALPAGWQGRASPWGSDAEDTQAQRTSSALSRARREWPWLPVMLLPALRYPAAAADDPVHGFALLNADLSPRDTFAAAKRSESLPATEPASALFSRFLAALSLLLASLALVTWRGVHQAARLPWRGWASRFLAWPEHWQMAALAAVAAAFYFAPWPVVEFPVLVLMAVLCGLRPDLGLVLAVFSIPFYLQPKTLFGAWAFSPLEILILVVAAAWATRQIATALVADPSLRTGGDGKEQPALGSWLHGMAARLRTRARFLRPSFAFDLPILLLLALSLFSLTASADVRLSLRELRTVVAEPILLYFLITRTAGGWRSQVAGEASPPALADLPSAVAAVRRLAMALVGGAAAAAVWGLLEYVFTSHVITAEGGLRRLIGPYPSPNALGLVLERALPLALALALALALTAVVGRSGRGAGQPGGDGERQGEPTAPMGDKSRGSGAWPGLLLGWTATLALAVALLLTFSVGAWAGAAAGCALVVLRQPRRLALGLAALAVVAGLLALPLLRTQRVASHFDLQSVTTSAVRVAVWQSAVEMVRNHPWQGVGLDGFLDLYRSQYIRPEAWREPDLSHPHNLILETWLSLGILGPPALLWLLGAFFWRAHRVYAASRDAVAKGMILGMVAGMAAGVVHGLVDRFLAGAPDLSAVFFLFLAGMAILGTGRREEALR